MTTNRVILFPEGNFAAATKALSNCAGFIYALDDFGRRFESSPFRPLVMLNAVEALTAAIRANLRIADGAIVGSHQASHNIARAWDALGSLDSFMSAAILDDKFMVSARTIGRLILESTVSAAQEIERAELACGKEDTETNYLMNTGRDPNAASPEQEAGHG